MSLYVCGLLVCGLSYDGSTEATLFTDAPLDPTTIPAGLSPLSSSTQVVARMAAGGISGGAARFNSLRDPLLSSTAPSASLQDDALGTFAEFFAPDPGWTNTTRWVLNNKVRVESSDVSLVLTGGTAPTVAQLVWLNNECLRIDSVSTVGQDHTCGITRARCGSRALTHALDPESYPDGDDGTKQAMTVYSRQLFEGGRRIEAALYHFRMSDTAPGAVAACEWTWYGYLAERPRSDSDMVYSVPVQHMTKAVEEATIKGGAAMELTHVIEVSGPPLVAGYVVGGATLPSIRVRLTRYEYERLYNTAIHHGQSDTVNTTLYDTVRTDLLASIAAHPELVVEANGHTWIYRPTHYPPAINDDGYETIRISCSFVARSQGASNADDPQVYPAEDGFDVRRDQGFSAGWCRSLGDVSASEYRVRTSQGEAAPKVSLRWRIKPATWSIAALYLLLSHHGDGSNDATYDVIPGQRGLGFNPNWVNIGSAPADALTVDSGTQAWLELDALYNDSYEYAFRPGDKLGDWFRNECVLRSAVLAFVPSTGKLAARVWARTPSSIATLLPITDMGPVSPGQMLDEQRALFLERGIDPVTLEPRYRKPLQLEGARAVDTKDAPTVRIWKQGGAFTDLELASGALAALERAQFGSSLGTPQFFQIPATCNSGLSFADIVYWTDPSIPTATGRGFTARRLVVLGLDRKPGEGHLVAYCLEDVLGREDAQNGQSSSYTASGLRITGIVSIDTTARTAEVLVEGLAVEQAFRGDTSDGALWSAIQGVTGHIRIAYYGAHNPSLAKERRGSVELYATLTGLSYDSGLRQTNATIAWAASQTSTRSLDAADIIRVGATLHLPDHRPSTATPGGVSLTLSSAMNTEDLPRVWVSSASRKPRFDGWRSLISAE